MRDTLKLESLRSQTTLRGVLGSARLPLALGALVTLLTLPAILQGWVADDLLHRQMLMTLPLRDVLKGLFVFAHPDPGLQQMGLSVQVGTMPWWTLDSLRIAFFRPLAVLSHWLDYQLWPNSAVLMHLQNILWYAAACVLTALYYRRLIRAPWVAGIAAFLYAVDIVHLGAVSWVANRNAVMALMFGMLALLMHDRWRRARWSAGAFWSAAFLAMALLSSEAGLATTAYLAAYAAFLDSGTPRQRLASLLPAMLLVVLWRLGYQAMGYGAWGSGFYVDPGAEPFRFASAVVTSGPILLLGQWLGQVPVLYNLLSLPASRVAWLLAVGLLTLLGIVFWPLLRRDRLARFWASGMLLALLPACSITLLSGRVLIMVGLGAMGLLAQLVADFVDRASWIPADSVRHVLTRASVWLMIGLHAVLSPLLMPLAAWAPGGLQAIIDEVTDIGAWPGVEQKDVVIVNAPSPFNLIYVASQRWERSTPMPRRLRVLAPGYAAVSVTRTDDRTLRVRPENGYLPDPGTSAARSVGGGAPLAHPVYLFQLLEKFFRSSAFPMALNESVDLTDMQVQVTDLTADGRPAEATIRLVRSLDETSLLWLQWDWQEEAFVPFQPPDIGETVQIKGPF